MTPPDNRPPYSGCEEGGGQDEAEAARVIALRRDRHGPDPYLYWDNGYTTGTTANVTDSYEASWDASIEVFATASGWTVAVEAWDDDLVVDDWIDGWTGPFTVAELRTEYLDLYGDWSVLYTGFAPE